jgi:phosphatidylglycerophosphatase A
MDNHQREPLSATSRWIVFVSQGFSFGRIPVAPGTFGSLLGFLWFAMLIAPGNLWSFLVGLVLGFACSVWLCGVAEKVLGRNDPPSVVLDEIVALPVCFLPWIFRHVQEHHSMPAFNEFFARRTWYGTVAIFVLFRLFDIVKPWPVRQSQKLPGGLGVTVDDFLAAAYVALMTTGFLLFR